MCVCEAFTDCRTIALRYGYLIRITAATIETIHLHIVEHEYWLHSIISQNTMLILLHLISVALV